MLFDDAVMVVDDAVVVAPSEAHWEEVVVQNRLAGGRGGHRHGIGHPEVESDDGEDDRVATLTLSEWHFDDAR